MTTVATGLVPVHELKRRLRMVHQQLQEEQLAAMANGEKFVITDPLIEERYYAEWGLFNRHWRGTSSEEAERFDSKRRIAEFKRSAGVGRRANGTTLPAWVNTDSHGQWWFEDIVAGCRAGQHNSFVLLDAVISHYFKRGREQQDLGDLCAQMKRAIEEGRLTEDEDGNWWWSTS